MRRDDETKSVKKAGIDKCMQSMTCEGGKGAEDEMSVTGCLLQGIAGGPCQPSGRQCPHQDNTSGALPA